LKSGKGNLPIPPSNQSTINSQNKPPNPFGGGGGGGIGGDDFLQALKSKRNQLLG